MNNLRLFCSKERQWQGEELLHTTFSLLTLENDLAQAYLINPVITAINIYQTPGTTELWRPGAIYF